VNNFNNDHHSDITFSDCGNGNLGIILGYGNRSFGNLTTYSTGETSRQSYLAAGDFNNDDQLDIAVVTYSTNTLVIFLGFGDGTFTLFTTYSTGDNVNPMMVILADLNKDNQSDVIVANQNSNSVGVLLGRGYVWVCMGEGEWRSIILTHTHPPTLKIRLLTSARTET
jgi:hypothetical protein